MPPHSAGHSEHPYTNRLRPKNAPHQPELTPVDGEVRKRTVKARQKASASKVENGASDLLTGMDANEGKGGSLTLTEDLDESDKDSSADDL